MNFMRCLALAAIVCMVVPSVTRAEGSPPTTVLAVHDSLAPGMRVRVATARTRDIQTGTIAWLTADTLSLDADDRSRAFPIESIRSLDRSTDRHSKAGKGATLGAIVGGAVMGLTVGKAAAENDGDFAVITVPIVIVSGIVAGGIVGAVTGSAIDTEEWVPVSLSGQVRAVPGDRVRVSGGGVPEGGVVIGTLEQRTADTLYVTRGEGRVSVPMSRPVSLELSLGVERPSRNTSKVLSAIGLIGGAVAGGTILAHGDPGWSYGTAIVVGATIGAASGWLLGVPFDRAEPRELWRTVDTR
ncbi:MAG TPA: hypothetical protein VFX78_06310 [Candidatus Eisenbacteria bacterium]|nr:hypothetical protein [Candidatus Eisenbacteria bacterium]